MARQTLNSSQIAQLASQPLALQEAVYTRIETSLRMSAYTQLASYYLSGINQATLERVMEEERYRINVDQSSHNVIVRLIGNGAPFSLLFSLCNLDRSSFKRIRERLGITATPNRRVAVDDALSVKLYRDWESMGKTVDAETILKLHDSSGESIYAIWQLLQEWQDIQLKTSVYKHKVKGR
jgi:hypothetical protein